MIGDDLRIVIELWYCGCCGNTIGPGVDPIWWCEACEPHIGASGHAWERTYFALTGKPCPYQVGEP